MSDRHGLLVRLAARRIPAPYRDEIVADLQERHPGRLSLMAALLRSARDARTQMTQTERINHPSAGPGWGTDLVGAWRQHRAHPWGALSIVLILAAAIGLNTALFSMVRGVLLRPLSFAQQERLVFVWAATNAGARQPMAPARAFDLGRRSDAIESSALIGHLSMNVIGAGPADRWYGASVSSTFFDVLGAPAALGRTFSPADSARDVVVLTDRLWRQRFQADPSLIGRSLVMNGRARQVIGVMPPTFYWPSITAESSAIDPPLFFARSLEADVPEGPNGTRPDAALDRQTGFVRMVARLKPGVSVAQAEASLGAVAAALGREFPATDQGIGATVVGVREQMFGAVQRPILFIWLASAIVVLVACVNVGTLVLVRQAGRRREFAVRSALGASRAQLARQLIAESVVLALAGGVVGVGLAVAGLNVLVAAAPQSVGRLDQVRIDLWVLGAAVAASLSVGVMLGALAAAGLWRDRSAESLRGAGTAEPSRARARQVLVAIEAGLAVMLVVVATLFGGSLVRLYRVDVGFDPRNLLTFNVAVSGNGAHDPARQIEFFDRLIERLRAIPGVRSAGAAVTLPVGGDDFGGRMYVQGRPLPAPGTAPRIGFQAVEPGWFQTLGLPILEGRDFNRTDLAQAEPVVIVNRALAESLFPGQRAVGQRVRTARDPNEPAMTIVGVVGNVRHNGPAVAARQEFYRPFAQEPFSFMAVAVRTANEPRGFVDAIRAAVAEIDPSQPISEASTMEAYLERAYGRTRFLATLTLLFGALALVLAVLGVYGVTSFSVAQRSREFGVRVALGATPSRLIREVLGDSLKPVVFGAALGLGAAVAVSLSARALLFDTAPTETSAYLAAAAILIAAASLGGLMPARRAATVDPIKALRDA